MEAGDDNQVDTQGEKHGIWRYYHNDNTIHYEITYRHGVLNGSWKRWEWDAGKQPWINCYLINEKEEGESIKTNKYSL